MAGNNLDKTLNFAVIFYCAVFGSAFFLSSTLFLYSLHRVEVSPDGPYHHPNIILPDAHDDENHVNESTTLLCTNQLNDWKMYANIGLIYGLVYIMAAVFQLWPIFDACCVAALKLGQMPSSFTKRNLTGHFNTAFVTPSNCEEEEGQPGQIVGPPRQSVLQATQDQTPPNDEVGGCCESFCQCLYIVVPYTVIVGLWLFSLILPAYLAVVLNSTDAVRVKDERLLWPAIALFITCLVSEAVVFVSACVFICLDGEGEDDDHDDQSSTDPGSNVTTIDSLA